MQHCCMQHESMQIYKSQCQCDLNVCYNVGSKAVAGGTGVSWCLQPSMHLHNAAVSKQVQLHYFKTKHVFWCTPLM